MESDMKDISKFLLSILICICLSFLVFFASEGFCKNITQKKQIIIAMDRFPQEMSHENKQIMIDESILNRLFPEIKNPRLMTFKDLEDPDEQEDFVNFGYAFILRGDFNKDGIDDLAFIGKYDNPENVKENVFIAIITIKGEKVTREFFSKLRYNRASLKKILNYKPNIDAIGIAYTISSNYCEYLYWTGKKYKFEPCKGVFP